MHDIDRAMFEMEQEGTFGESGEVLGESFEAYEAHSESEAQEVELASELLEVASEQELEQFLGGLISSAASAARGFAGSATGRALGGVLKDVARQALPQLGQVIGNAVVPGAGGQFGQRAGQWLGTKFELEGLSAEDRELEVARAVIRLTRDATQHAVSAGPAAPPRQAANAALRSAAQRQLPALVPLLDQRSGRASSGSPEGPRSGRWVRRGTRIVLMDL
ncbi:hypothetical protein SAMN04488543_2700 [Friedmanniella luteola]|uniref:Uncharacterized protein n=1 Tax=Friedmanniella luteola TaxID=546871 RepID=A0A1H1WE03_9ACTN|nr:hypothetical protein [Friedmanniella luteola]SDS94880.1 hypothetical protein SAMN04488543_2700 [Friedmanniella luteola]